MTRNTVHTTISIDRDKLAWAKQAKFNLSKFLDNKLAECIPQDALLLVRQRRIKAELALNEQELEKIDKYGATKF